MVMQTGAKEFLEANKTMGNGLRNPSGAFRHSDAEGLIHFMQEEKSESGRSSPTASVVSFSRSNASGRARTPLSKTSAIGRSRQALRIEKSLSTKRKDNIQWKREE